MPERLGLAPDPARRVTAEQFERGRASQVRLLEVPGYGRLVLRLFPRKRHRREVTGRRELHQTLAAHDIPAPKVLFVDTRRAARRAYGFWALGEEFIEGWGVSELSQGERERPLVRLGDLLARLHAIRHPHAGKPWEGRRRRVRRWAKREAAEWMRRIRTAELGLSSQRARALGAWFPEQFRRLERTEYPLVHGDPTPQNLLAGEGGEVFLLDFGRAAHWLPQFDLVIAEHWLRELAPDETAEFLDRYFRGAAGSPALSRAEYKQTRALFLAWFYLDCTSGLVRRARRQRERGQASEETARKAEHFWSLTERYLAESGAL